MDELYYIDLFHQNFHIDGKNCKLISQFLIQAEDHRYANILLLCDKEKVSDIFLIALNYQSKKIVPISIGALNTVVRAIKRIPFSSKYQDEINSLTEREYSEVDKTTLIKLTQNISAFVDKTTMILRTMNIELELLEGKRRAPADFAFAAFDGINISISFVLDNEFIAENRDWGVLSKICFYINEKVYDEYYLINNHKISESQTEFLCQPKMNLILSRRKTLGMNLAGINIYEMSDFLLSSAGLYNSVHIPDDYLKQQKWYTIVIPLTGLQFSEEFGLGGIEFFNKENIEIGRIIEFDNRFAEYDVFALVHINEAKMHSAFMAAKRQIEQATDLLVNVLKDDSIFSIHSCGKYLSERNIEFFEKRVDLSPLAYIESPQTNTKVSLNISEPDDSPNLTVTKQFLQQKDELEKVELLLIKANGTNDENITPIFNSLKWIRKAWDSTDFDDKIINAVIALEFIVSKESSIPLMSKPTRKSCESAIREIILDLKDDTIVDKDHYLEEVLATFSRAFTDSPFMVKLKNLINRLRIPVSDGEMDLILKARKQRNEIVHGRKEIGLPTDDVYRLCECIGKIAFYKLYSLEG